MVQYNFYEEFERNPPIKEALGPFHKSIVFYDTKKLVYFTNKSFPENDRKKCCTNKILNLEVS